MSDVETCYEAYYQQRVRVKNEIKMGGKTYSSESPRTDKSGHTHTEMRHDTCDGERHTCPMFNTLMANVGLSKNQNVMCNGQISYCTKVLWLRRNLPLHAQVKFGIINLIP